MWTPDDSVLYDAYSQRSAAPEGMIRNRVLTYDGSSVSVKTIEAAGALRWVSWKHDGSEAVIVGNNGTILSYSEGGKTIRQIFSPVDVNLRGVDFSPDGKLAVIAGNAGTLLILSDYARRLESGTTSNFRKVSWKRDGSGALIVGNEGAAFFLGARGLKRVYGVGNNLRSISWHPKEDYAVVVGNSVKATLAGLVPAPGFYKFDTDSFNLTPLRQTSPETPKDLTSASWKPDGSQCVIVGYDQTWYNSELYTFDGKSISDSEWRAEKVFPTGFSWHPSGGYGVIVTGGLKGEGTGMILRYENNKPSVAHEEKEYRITCLAWNPSGNQALILGSRNAQSYSS